MCGINRFTRDERIDLIDRGLSTTSGLLAVAVLIGVPGVILVSWNIHGRRLVASDQAHAVVGIALATLIIGLLISGLVVAWWCKRVIDPRRLAVGRYAEQHRVTLLPLLTRLDASRNGFLGFALRPVSFALRGSVIVNAWRFGRQAEQEGLDYLVLPMLVLLLVPGAGFVIVSNLLGLDRANGCQDATACVAITAVAAFLVRRYFLDIGARLLAGSR